MSFIDLASLALRAPELLDVSLAKTVLVRDVVGAMMPEVVVIVGIVVVPSPSPSPVGAVVPPVAG